MKKHIMEEDLVVISVKTKKNVVKYFIYLNKPVEQKTTVFPVPPFKS